MIPVLGVPILNRPELLAEMLSSVDHPVERVVIVDNGDVVPPETSGRVIRPGANLGVAASWNLIIKSTIRANWWLLANFDLTFEPGFLSVIEDEIDRHQVVMAPNAACFAVRYDALERVGLFDESFVPAYYEDNDFRWRCIVAGIDVLWLPEDQGIRHLGSATINADQKTLFENHRTFPENGVYYRAKWGGMPYEEVYRTPFDGGSDIRSWTMDVSRLRRLAWKR